MMNEVGLMCKHNLNRDIITKLPPGVITGVVPCCAQTGDSL